MVNKFLIFLDKILKGLNRLHQNCKKIPKVLLGAITSLDACCLVVSFLGKDRLEDIKILKTAYYDTVVALFPKLVDYLLKPEAKLITGVLTALLLCIWSLRLFYRYPALLISHSTMGHNLNDISQTLSKNFWFKKKQIEHRIHDASDIVKAINIQDDAYKYIEKNNWRSTIFYYGVAHTPLVFRLGYQFGQTRKIRFLHRFRQTEDSQEFDELPQNDQDRASIFKSDEISMENFNSNSQEMIVAISTTYEIKREDYIVIDPEHNMFPYEIKINESDRRYDFINSYHKIHSYADRFVDDIRKICKERNIRKIHIVLSTSVPFTFYLAQQMNTNQFPEIVVYHYDISDERKYPWGIRIKNSNADDAVVWTKIKK